MFEIGEKEKLKGTNMQQPLDSGIHDTSGHCPRVHQVPEKNLMKIFNV